MHWLLCISAALGSCTPCRRRHQLPPLWRRLAHLHVQDIKTMHSYDSYRSQLASASHAHLEKDLRACEPGPCLQCMQVLLHWLLYRVP